MKICILGNGIDKALCGDYDGGAERQSALIAVALSRRGHQVVVLETDASAKARVLPEGVKLVPAWSRDRGLSGLRFLTYRMPSLLRAVRDADPDVIYCRGASMYAACLMLALRGRRHRFVWHLAAQQDVEPRLTYARTFNCSPYTWLHAGPIFNLSARMLLKYADRVICETREELDVVNRKRRDASIVPTICERIVASKTTPGDVCLWVGKFTGIKGERELLELAKTLPEMRFRAVGHVSRQFADSSLYREIVSQSNIHLVGRLQHNDLMREYPSAALLVHTAPAEGFSNVFLEAWA